MIFSPVGGINPHCDQAIGVYAWGSSIAFSRRGKAHMQVCVSNTVTQLMVLRGSKLSLLNHDVF